MNQRLRLLTVLFLAIPCLVPAQKPSLHHQKLLDSLIFNRLPQVAPGCVVLVAEKGRVVYKKAFGFANLELRVPMRPEMLFRIGSITKQYTAIAILGLLPLDFAPGTQFHYGNSNYFLLGYILQQVSGSSYSDYLDKNLLGPARKSIHSFHAPQRTTDGIRLWLDHQKTQQHPLHRTQRRHRRFSKRRDLLSR